VLWTADSESEVGGFKKTEVQNGRAILYLKILLLAPFCFFCAELHHSDVKI
jgi:hypothetical protein